MIVLGIILAVIVLILLLPVGAYARYDGNTLVRLIAGPLRIQLVPAKPKSRKQLEKAKRKKEQKAAKKAENKKKAAAKKLVYQEPKPKPQEPLPDKIRGLLPFAKLAVDALSSVFRRLTIKKLLIHVRFGGGDKAKLAESYGRTMALIWEIGPVLGRKFRIKKSDISVVPDFLADKTEVEAEIYLRYRVFDLLGIAFKYGFRGLRLLMARKKHEKELLVAQGLVEPAHKGHKTEIKTENTDKKVG